MDGRIPIVPIEDDLYASVANRIRVRQLHKRNPRGMLYRKEASVSHAANFCC